MSARVVLVGGGSYHWTPRLLCDFANTPSLADAEVVLHDPDRERLRRMAELGEVIAARRGIGLRTVAAPELEAAVRGADVVVTTLSVGGLDSMRHDLEIPARYGVRQPIGDSIGPGGIMRALRSIPVIVDIARRVEAVAPQAWFVNVSNPLTAIGNAVARATTRLRSVSLCNEWVGATFVLSLALDCGLDDLDPVLAGVNHFPLATQLRVRGEDAFARLLGLMDDPAARAEPIWMDPPEAMHWTKVSPEPHWTKGDVVENNRVRFEALRRFGVFPGASDHHTVEYVPGFVHPGNDFGRNWGVHHYGIDGHRAEAAADVAHYEAVRAAPDVTMLPSGEIVAAVLDGLVTGVERVLPVNVPNAGNVTNLDDGRVVEVMGVVDGTGARGRDRATVPGVFGEWLRRVDVVQRWTEEAAITGDRALVLEAMLADPLASQLAYDDVVALTDEMLTATARWLPQFA